jgi:hypothetical protein
MTSADERGESGEKGESGGTPEPAPAGGEATRPLPRPPGAASRERSERVWHGVAFGVLVVSLLTFFHAMLGEPFDSAVPVNVARGAVDEEGVYPRGPLDKTDHRFVIWQAARNAYTLLGRPLNLFQAEPCHPADNVLALGEPGITMGLLAAPAWAASGDPIVSYNAMVWLVAVVGFLAMYLLVIEWTGVPAAAIVAALLFAFHEIKLKDSIHLFAWDNSWTVLSLYFVTRLFRHGRWGDAVGLAVAICMQLAGSFYPLLAAIFLAGPILVWLIARHGVRQLRPQQWAFVALCMGVVAWAIFSPYLAASASGAIEDRGYKVFLDPKWLTLSGPAFPGWALLTLVLASLALPRRLVAPPDRGDPRIALVVIALVLFSISFGGNTVARLEAMQAGEPLPPEVPNLYDALALLIPGMDQVRGPAALYQGTQMALCLLAGLGAAALVRAAGSRRALLVGGALILFAFVEGMRPAWLGLSPRIDYVPWQMRPAQPELDFFARAAELGSQGPILELPFNPRNIDQSSRAVLLAAYHRRRTSQCFNSFMPPSVWRVKEVADRLPEAAAMREIADMGFRSILIRHPFAQGLPMQLRDRFVAFAETAEGSNLRAVLSLDGLTLYDVESSAPEIVD